ncbi:MAG: CPBP family intramembrane metalloprotease [Sphingobacteriales bacterium]|jgi:membrane protease YdiL (CAAX protease family)|nr:CPBP family intramembrane metalloprotease [Sphingobacteriales bacterium]
MPLNNSLKQSLKSSVIYTGLLSVVFIILSWQKNSAVDIFIALPFFISLYFIFFTIDRPAVNEWLRADMQNNIKRVSTFPFLLTILFLGYLACNGANPLKGSLLLVPYLLFFPVLAMAARRNNSKIDWFDFAIFVLFFFPVTLVDVKPSGDLPFNGGGFDSVYRITVMLSALFTFSIIRNLNDIGAYPVFRWRFLITTIGVWLSFYLFVFLISYPVHFIRFADDNSWNFARIEKIFWSIVSVFLHTALFEELVFRGLLQNLLGKRIAQATSWKNSWSRGIIILIIISLIIGYSMKGGLHWFPALVTVFLFGAAYLFEKLKFQSMGSYTALAITSVIFGLVHFHSGSIIFTGLAAIGGWAYGYVYMKTKNTFYAALLHALVNSSPIIFGIVLAK